MSSSPKPSQREYWNSPSAEKWVALQDALDGSLGPIGALALEALNARPGERVLDVGCGCGTTTLELGQRVGPTGAVLGVDVSAPMLAHAKSRGKDSANVTFQEGDAGADLPTDGAWDALFSRFGVMFFEHPPQAFERLLKTLRPGGRAAFVCWASPKENLWATVPFQALVELIGPQEPSDPHAPGPFAFADPKRVQGILEGAGFVSVSLVKHEPRLRLGSGVGLDDAARYAMRLGPSARLAEGLDEATRERFYQRLLEVLAPYDRDGVVALPASVWCVTAKRPEESTTK